MVPAIAAVCREFEAQRAELKRKGMSAANPQRVERRGKTYYYGVTSRTGKSPLWGPSISAIDASELRIRHQRWLTYKYLGTMLGNLEKGIPKALRTQSYLELAPDLTAKKEEVA